MLTKKTLTIARTSVLFSQRPFHKATKEFNIQYQQASLGENFQPKQFSKEEILQTIDPKSVVRKEPHYEYKDIP